MVMGDVGAGKTLMLAILSQYTNRPIFTNFHLYNSNKPVEKFEVEYILNKTINSADVFIDEFYLYMEARNFMSDINGLFSYFAFQSRKLNLRLWLTVQLLRTVDIRMREMITNIIECEAIKDNDENTIAFKYIIYSNVNKSQFEAPKEIYLDIESAKPYFSIYDTYEVVKTPMFERIKRNVAVDTYSDKEILEIARNCVSFLHRNNLKVNKTNIGVYCIKKGYSNRKDFINNIYADSILLKAK